MCQCIQCQCPAVALSGHASGTALTCNRAMQWRPSLTALTRRKINVLREILAERNLKQPNIKRNAMWTHPLFFALWEQLPGERAAQPLILPFLGLRPPCLTSKCHFKSDSWYWVLYAIALTVDHCCGCRDTSGLGMHILISPKSCIW